MTDLRSEIHDAWARVREDGEVWHADVENALLVVADMVDRGVLTLVGRAD